MVPCDNDKSTNQILSGIKDQAKIPEVFLSTEFMIR